MRRRSRRSGGYRFPGRGEQKPLFPCGKGEFNEAILGSFCPFVDWPGHGRIDAARLPRYHESAAAGTPNGGTMPNHPLVKSLFDRKSVRAFTDRPVPEDIKNLILDAGIQAPSAGNQQLYTILDIDDPAIKERLAELCDHQPLVARAPFVLVFLADTRRWLDAYRAAGLAAREPGPGDLLLAAADTLIAAQNMVVAASVLGLGSCYIGDVLENREAMTGLLGLDPLVMPVTLLVFGYPAPGAAERPKPPRPRREYLVQKNRYARRSAETLRALHGELCPGEDFDRWMAAFCARKYMSGFAHEMNRSAGEYLKMFCAPR